VGVGVATVASPPFVALGGRVVATGAGYPEWSSERSPLRRDSSATALGGG
jgi:hypothetical protein